MANLQETILRARFIFSNAPKRYEVFRNINGKNSTKDIAIKTTRSLSAVCQDIEKLKDFELIKEKNDKNGYIKKDGATVYEKCHLIKHVPDSFFSDIFDSKKITTQKTDKIQKSKKPLYISIPSDNDILEICRNGENQLYEFKSPGVKIENITEEIAAFLHTKRGGIIFYGIDDNGTVVGSDIKRQYFDQSIQNSIRNTISPAPIIEITEKSVLGIKIILLIIFPWDRKSLYQYTKKERYLIRKGTNKFALRPNEIKKLTKGEYVI